MAAFKVTSFILALLFAHQILAQVTSCNKNIYDQVIAHLAPECFAACPEVCPILDEAMETYLAGSDPTQYVCKNKKALECVMSNANSAVCAKLMQVSEGFGVNPYEATATFDKICKDGGSVLDVNIYNKLDLLGKQSSKAFSKVAEPSAQAPSWSCSTNYYGSILASLAPACFQACPQVCPVLDEAFSIFMRGSDPTHYLCRKSGDLECVMSESNSAVCTKLIEISETFGVNPWAAQSMFDKVCRDHGSVLDINIYNVLSLTGKRKGAKIGAHLGPMV